MFGGGFVLPCDAAVGVGAERVDGGAVGVCFRGDFGDDEAVVRCVDFGVWGAFVAGGEFPVFVLGEAFGDFEGFFGEFLDDRFAGDGAEAVCLHEFGEAGGAAEEEVEVVVDADVVGVDVER